MKPRRNAVPEALARFFESHPRVALAFSGGCDSAYLFYAALACGVDVHAYYVKSPFQPAFELNDALRLTKELGGKMTVLEEDVLADAQICANPADRCYHCKRRLFSRILEAAQAEGYPCVIDGTNASDDASDRPGMRALTQLAVLSPLRLSGITKAEVRSLSKRAGLFTWKKPAYACLATRIPAGTPIEGDMLERIERAEAALHRMGFSDLRVRVRSGGAQLELLDAQLPLLLERRAEVLHALEKDFETITLNLKTRKGITE